MDATRRRIDQMLSRCGYCSRSEARAWVRSGRVQVDGVAATASDAKAPLDSIRVDGEPLEAPLGLLALFHKPSDCICSHDPNEGSLIFKYFPERWLRRNPVVTSVGRLDKDTTGVLLMTDLGELVQRWTSPRHKVPKVYEISVDRDLPESLVELFASGKLLLVGEDQPCLPSRLEIIGPRQARLELVEGRYHQVKRMFVSQGIEVVRLHRSRFGDYTVEDLEPGKWRLLPLPAVR